MGTDGRCGVLRWWRPYVGGATASRGGRIRVWTGRLHEHLFGREHGDPHHHRRSRTRHPTAMSRSPDRRSRRLPWATSGRPVPLPAGRLEPRRDDGPRAPTSRTARGRWAAPPSARAPAARRPGGSLVVAGPGGLRCRPTHAGRDMATSSSKRRRDRTGTRFVFIDTEATGLDHRRHELTEVVWVVRFEDGREVERRFFPEHTTDGADADALELTHHAQRIAPQPKTPAREWLTTFLADADGAVLVGAVPDFDARHLERLCHQLGRAPTWDHHLLDVETLALPLIAPGPEAPRSLAKTCRALGIPHDQDQAHGALYDARQAMRVFDRVHELLATLRSSGAPLPPPVPRIGPLASRERLGADGAEPTGSEFAPPPAEPTDHPGTGQGSSTSTV